MTYYFAISNKEGKWTVLSYHLGDIEEFKISLRRAQSIWKGSTLNPDTATPIGSDDGGTWRSFMNPWWNSPTHAARAWRLHRAGAQRDTDAEENMGHEPAAGQASGRVAQAWV